MATIATEARKPIRWARRRNLLALALIVAVGVAITGAVRLVDEGTTTLTGPTSEPFAVDYPSAWRALDASELQAFAPAPPLAVLRHEDGKGILVVRREKPFAANLRTFATDLRQELDKRLADFREVGARVVQVGGTNAFFYSYVRERRGTVHTITVVPAGASRSYVLTSVSQPGADGVAREIASMINSFSPATR